MDLAQLRRYQEAIVELDLALDLAPDEVVPHYNRGIVRYQLEDCGGAIDDFTEVLVRKPDVPIALMNRGVAYSKLGHFDEAIADLNSAVSAVARTPEAYFNRAIVHGKMRNWDLVLADLTIVIEMPSNPSLCACPWSFSDSQTILLVWQRSFARIFLGCCKICRLLKAVEMWWGEVELAYASS